MQKEKIWPPYRVSPEFRESSSDNTGPEKRGVRISVYIWDPIMSMGGGSNTYLPLNYIKTLLCPWGEKEIILVPPMMSIQITNSLIIFAEPTLKIITFFCTQILAKYFTQ